MQAGELGEIADELDLFAKPLWNCPETDFECFHDILLLGGNEACLASFLMACLAAFLTAFLATFLTELFGE